MRITNKILAAQIDFLNKRTNNALIPLIKIDDRLIWNIGNYHLSIYNSSATLHQVSSESGGVTEICPSCTKKELYRFIQGFLLGLDQIH